MHEYGARKDSEGVGSPGVFFGERPSYVRLHVPTRMIDQARPRCSEVMYSLVKSTEKVALDLRLRILIQDNFDHEVSVIPKIG